MHLNNLLGFPGIKHPPSHWIPYQKEEVFFRKRMFPNISVRFIRCRSFLDCCLSVEFTESENMAVRSNSAVSENLRIREFKECVSARPHLRKRGIHKCFPQWLLKFPETETLVSVKKPLNKRTRKLLISPCDPLRRRKAFLGTLVVSINLMKCVVSLRYYCCICAIG